MDAPVLNLPIQMKSEDEKEYLVVPFTASMEKIDFLWEQTKVHDFMFSSETRGRKDLFEGYLLSRTVVVLDVYQIVDEKDVIHVGILYADQIIPGTSARGHYLFWDHVQGGRSRVILSGLRWAMETFDLHRINIEIPRHAFSALRRMYRMQLRLEGERREAIKTRKDKWADVLLFGIVRGELTDEVIHDGRLQRSEKAADWFGLLKNRDAILTKAVMRED